MPTKINAQELTLETLQLRKEYVIRKDEISMGIYKQCGTWNICVEKLISYLVEQLGLHLLTKFHPSDITDRIKQSNHRRVISFHIPFMFMKGKTFRESDNAWERKNNNKPTITNHTGHLSKDGSQNPKDTLKIENLPKISRVLLVQHANRHYAEERQIHEEVGEYAPAERIRPRDDTCICQRKLRRPYSMALHR